VHELGILYQAIRTVDRIAGEQKIRQVRHITLDVGTESTFVPAYLEKLFPLAIDRTPVLKDAQLRLRTVPGQGLTISEIGY
jgi:hydrogenase nickel incorporation protein HypA/HybF